MQSWQLVLRVRQRVCENRLWDAYRRHGNVVNERRRCPEMGPSWHKKDDVLASLQREMRREMEELRFIRTLLKSGWMGGLTLVMSGGTKGPSIRELIERLALREQNLADLSQDFTQTKRDHEFKAEGLRLAVEVLTNPYRFLDASERAAVDLAESESDAIVAARAPDPSRAQRIMPAGNKGPSLADVKARGKSQTVVRRRKPDEAQ